MSKIICTFQVERIVPAADGERYPDKTTIARFEIEAWEEVAIEVYQKALTQLTAPAIEIEEMKS